MEAKKQAESADDLSMEDILQSIRRIIADDDNEKNPEEAAVAAPETATTIADTINTDTTNTDAINADGVAGSDILELTDMLEDDGSVTTITAPQIQIEAVDIVAAPAPEPLAEPVVEAVVEQEPEPIPEPQAAPVLTQPSPPPPTVSMPDNNDDELDALLSKAAESAALSALEKLKIPEDKPPLLHPDSPAFRSGNTVEDMVAEMLHPMLKEWLDGNLPAIVERIVEREVMRLTRR